MIVTILALDRFPCCRVSMQKANAAMYSPAQNVRLLYGLHIHQERTAFGLRTVHLRGVIEVDRSLLTTAKALEYWALTRVIVSDSHPPECVYAPHKIGGRPLKIKPSKALCSAVADLLQSMIPCSSFKNS